MPAQFLQHSGKLVAEAGGAIRYRLISLWPIYRRNAPATPLERQARETVTAQPDRPFIGIVTGGRKRSFQAVYADRAVSQACVSCHNSHPLSPKHDFKLNDVMGGIAITIPLERGKAVPREGLMRQSDADTEAGGVSWPAYSSR